MTSHIFWYLFPSFTDPVTHPNHGLQATSCSLFPRYSLPFPGSVASDRSVSALCLCCRMRATFQFTQLDALRSMRFCSYLNFWAAAVIRGRCQRCQCGALGASLPEAAFCCSGTEAEEPSSGFAPSLLQISRAAPSGGVQSQCPCIIYLALINLWLPSFALYSSSVCPRIP